MTQYKVFINKSTVPVGTGEICKEIIEGELDKKGQTQGTAPTDSSRGEPCVHPTTLTQKFDIVSNPEFLKE